MTLKTLSAAVMAATLLGTVAHADITIIQTGPSGAMPDIQMPAMPNVQLPGHIRPPAQMHGDGFGIASAFIRDMMADRMPGFDIDAMGAIDAAPIIEPPAPISFAGHWDLLEIFDVNAMPLAFSEELLSRAEFTVDAEGSFHASVGCNSIFGHLEEDVGTLETGEIMATLMACAEPVQSMERALTRSLSDAALFAHGHDRLVFLSVDGRPLVRFGAEVE